MANLDLLLQKYERFITPAWPANVAGPQRVLFAVYDPKDERRLRARVGEFELATTRAKRHWALCDVTDVFPQWMAEQKYRESYFAEPEDLAITLGTFEQHVADQVRAALTAPGIDADSVVGVIGVGALFGFMHVSRLVELVEKDIRGRMLVFFPGQHDSAVYRLLDARDGWNYHAIPITAQS